MPLIPIKPIRSTNNNILPSTTLGKVLPFPGAKAKKNKAKNVFKSITLPQVAGLVPLFPCQVTDCRQGDYRADIIADDTQFPLPVFASSDVTNQYENDSNSFLFELPINFGGTLDFYLDKLINGVWTKVADLNTDDYGKFYSYQVLCFDKDWRGYRIDWNKVWSLQGTGMYKFRVHYSITPTTPTPEPIYCFASPPFCLAEFNCYNADRTTKFEAYYAGGKIGDITKANSCQTSIFDYWEYCCCQPIFVNDGTGCQEQTFKAFTKFTGGANDLIQFQLTKDYSTNPYIYKFGKYSNDSTGGGFDNGNNYNASTSTYTAPCDGEYYFCGGFYGGITSNPLNNNIMYYNLIGMYVYIYDKYNNFKQKVGLISVGANSIGGPKINPMCNGDQNCTYYKQYSAILNQGDYAKVAFEVYADGSQSTATVTINPSNQTSCGFFAVTYSAGGQYYPGPCGPVNWYDSIRVNGFFGREEKEYERNNIKYHTGIVNKIRDEAIRKFKWRSFGNTADNPGRGLPFWFHDRFSVYGLMADDLLVSDYNYNNSDYNLKRYCVQADTGYSPEYKGNSRYSNVELDFKSKKQTLARNRCCD